MSTAQPSDKIRDIPPTTLRLPPDLRDLLMREATIARRSLSQEITLRLQSTFNPGRAEPGGQLAPAVESARGSYNAVPAQATDSQRMLLALFNAMAPDKQLALLTLLKR